MKKFAYAKINLTLEIIGKTPNGYHLIKSVFKKITLCDIIEAKISEKPEIKFAAFEPDGETTVEKSVRLFEQKTGIRTSIEIIVTKRIPMQSGMGGGSSDAAAILLMLNELYGSPLRKNELKEMALKIGADVPFFLNGKTALVEGTGEKITPIGTNPEKYFLLIAIPPFGYPTKNAYELFDRKGELSEKGYTKNLINCFENKCENLEEFLYNDFEKIYEQTDERFASFKNSIENITGKKFTLTGSGSALFAIYKNKESASTGFKALSGNGVNALISKFL